MKKIKEGSCSCNNISKKVRSFCFFSYPCPTTELFFVSQQFGAKRVYV